MKHLLASMVTLILTGLVGGQEMVWQVPDLQPREKINPRPSRVTWSEDGIRLATENHGEVAVFDVKAKKKLWQISHSDWGMGIAWPVFTFSPDGKHIAAAVAQKTLVLDANTGKIVKEIEPGAQHMSWDKDGLWLLKPQGFVLYDLRFKEKFSSRPNVFLRNVLYAQKVGDEILSIQGWNGWNQTAYVLSHDKERKVRVVRQIEDGKFLTARGGKILFQPNKEKTKYEICSTADEKKVSKFSLAGKAEQWEFSPCGEYVVIGVDGKAHIFDAAGNEGSVVEYGRGFGKGDWILCLAISHGCEFLAIGGSDGVKIYRCPK